MSGGVLSEGFCPGGGFVQGGFVHGGVLSSGVLSEGFCPGGGGVCPGGFCPRIVIPYTIDDAIVASDVSILKHRCPKEKIVNENGKELINLCVGNNLCIVNGRIGEYPDGSFTCHTARSESVVDYFIVNTEQLHSVSKFKVQANSPLSDHNCITMDIKLTSPTITSTSTSVQ